jgi:hypothetical protein
MFPFSPNILPSTLFQNILLYSGYSVEQFDHGVRVMADCVVSILFTTSEGFASHHGQGLATA